ncbi:MAG TPA: FKBP-type peptidyl-prolyl cis-trans isomerase [Pseudobdellovibrionaceae bacterium]|nr:FKBP-type peptidyl-prolyl cis-trans isomerase [Pseudobdellovibrionaceae bacterium]
MCDIKKVIGVALIAMGVVSCTKPGKPEGDLAQGSYALGVRLGKDLKGQIPDLDRKQFSKGLNEAFEGKAELKDEEIMQAMNKLRDHSMKKAMADAEVEKKKSVEFLENNKKNPGIVTTESGLQYQVITEGTGAIPTISDTVVCDYEGKLTNGEKFDSSYDRGKPAEFPVGGVIKGWTEALQKMKVGSKWKLFVPPDLGYGERGSPPKIPGGAALVFEVELKDIKKGEAFGNPHAEAPPAATESKTKKSKK